jgi:hypothetical protein
MSSIFVQVITGLTYSFDKTCLIFEMNVFTQQLVSEHQSLNIMF